MEKETAMTLSPAAQAVLDALHTNNSTGPGRFWARANAGAALRAAADRIAEEVPPGQSVWGEGYVEGVIFFRNELLVIAAELEGSL
jgi:hypothetical protein